VRRYRGYIAQAVRTSSEVKDACRTDLSSRWLRESVLADLIDSGPLPRVCAAPCNRSPRVVAAPARRVRTWKKSAAVPSTLERGQGSRSASLSRLFSSLGQHLSGSTQSLKNPKRDIFGSLASISSGTNTRRTSVLAAASTDQFARAGEQRAATPI
jgi:hypothetical protein